MLPPASEQPNDLLSAGIVGLKRFDALDRIATSQGDVRVAAPFCPSFEASKRLAAREPTVILATPPPDRQCGGEEFGSPAFNMIEKTSREWA
jgi:hypothetical protein